MAQLGFNANINDLPESSNDFEPLPAGWYTANINDAELRDTKAGTGQYIAIRYDIIGPTHQGRCVFGNLNIANPNPKAEEIGRQQLGSLMRAIGLNDVSDTDQLIGGNCEIKLVIRPAKDGYEANNDIKAWKALDGSAAPAPTAPTAAAPAPVSGGAPWQK